MPYRDPPRRELRARSRFVFPRVRVRLGVKRFELSFWDYEPLFVLFAGGPIAAGFLAGRQTVAGAFVIACVVALTSARRAFVVTPTAAWIEHRVVGIRWRRAPLGLRPTVASGPAGDWSEISIAPTEPALRRVLRDRERAVLAEWGANDPWSDDAAASLAEITRAEIARLQSE